MYVLTDMKDFRCLPVEDESDGCHYHNADAQNDHDHVLWAQF